MKYVITLLSVVFVASCYGAEQIPTFNLKNKTGRGVTLVVGVQNTAKPTVVMRVADQRTGLYKDHSYTAGQKMLLGANEAVSLYGLNIEEVQAIDCYYNDTNDKPKKLVAQFEGDYQTLYLKLVKKSGKIFLVSQEGPWGKGKTTDGYSLDLNIKDKKIKLQWPPSFIHITENSRKNLEKKNAISTVF